MDKIVLLDDQDNEIECSILFTYHSETFNKDYLFFYENEDEVNVLSRDQDDLFPVEDDKEWEEIQKAYDDYLKSQG